MLKFGFKCILNDPKLHNEKQPLKFIEAPLGGSTAAQSFWSREGCDKEGSLEEESLVI